MAMKDFQPGPPQGANDFRPFDLGREADYRQWREWKLADYPRAAEELIVPVANACKLSNGEKEAILQHCRKTNMALYAMTAGDIAGKEELRAFGGQFGLQHFDQNLRADEDSITSLRVVPEAGSTHYIPYTKRALNWHTDGYYNKLGEQVHGIVMHCVSEAATGGGSIFMDHEIAYLLMRDSNPDYIEAMMHPAVMTIPPNAEGDNEIRPEQTGPVFSIHPGTGTLHMRYTARTHSIAWRDDKITRLAVGFLEELLAGDSGYNFSYKLHSGQGIICNNVLHKREAFEDAIESGSSRLLYRARYHDRIRGTEMVNTVAGIQSCFG